MLKLIALSILLTFVFAWEEVKGTIRILVRGLAGRRNTGYYSYHLDKFVGTLILLATIPCGLLYFLASSQPLVYKLWVIFLQLFLFSLLSTGLQRFLKWQLIARSGNDSERWVPMVFSIIGLFYPLLHPFAGVDGQQRRTLAKFALFLSLPALLGIILKYYLDAPISNGLYFPNMDIGIVVLVGSLIIRITIDFLEYYFKAYRLEKFFSYYRIVIGIVLVLIVLSGLGFK